MSLSPSPPSPASIAIVVSNSTTKPAECKLIQGPVAFSAQFLLLCVVLIALFVKRHRERPRRPWNVWYLDISKQACSGLAGHAVGMTVAIVAHVISHQSSECGWYFVVYFADCTLGITLAILFHKLVHLLARHMTSKPSAAATELTQEHSMWEALLESGNYGDPPSYRKWGIQVVAWVLCVATARTIVGFVVVLGVPIFSVVTHYMDAKLAAHPAAYLFTVMVGIPVVMNVGQAWIQDQVLKWKMVKKLTKRDSEDLSSALNELSVSLVASHQRTRASERAPTTSGQCK